MSKRGYNPPQFYVMRTGWGVRIWACEPEPEADYSPTTWAKPRWVTAACDEGKLTVTVEATE